MESVADQVSGSVKPRQTDNAYLVYAERAKVSRKSCVPLRGPAGGAQKTVLKPAAPLS